MFFFLMGLRMLDLNHLGDTVSVFSTLLTGQHFLFTFHSSFSTIVGLVSLF